MKIICIGRNYSEHAKELGNTVTEKPIVFLKPQTALLKDNKPFYLPDWSSDIHYETELVLKVCKQGKYIEEKFANKYFDEVTVGIDFTARDLQAQQKTIADNQAKIDAKLAAITESLRQAKIYVSRGK